MGLGLWLVTGAFNWSELERAPHRRVECSQSIYYYIIYIWYVRHLRATIYIVRSARYIPEAA